MVLYFVLYTRTATLTHICNLPIASLEFIFSYTIVSCIHALVCMYLSIYTSMHAYIHICTHLVQRVLFVRFLEEPKLINFYMYLHLLLLLLIHYVNVTTLTLFLKYIDLNKDEKHTVIK